MDFYETEVATKNSNVSSDGRCANLDWLGGIESDGGGAKWDCWQRQRKRRNGSNGSGTNFLMQTNELNSNYSSDGGNETATMAATRSWRGSIVKTATVRR